MSKFSTFLKALWCLLFSFTAPFVMLFGMWTVSEKSTRLPWFLSWYRTPDEVNLVGLYEPDVASLWAKCWRCSVYVWYGWRNRAHGMHQLFAKEVSGWPDDRMGMVEFGQGLWIIQKQLTKHFRFIFGWGVYRNLDGKFWARPVLSIKWRSL